ncbi:MAG TPA: class I SAM-dependent methyltransferase, partial [Methanococcaceae archaeon]|nr:class I SAM-dependent methyltransferase [Methanococcaceae archaeon]
QDLYTKTRLLYLLRSAIDLGIFEHLEDFKTPKEVAKEVGCDEVLLEHTLEALNKIGLLDKKLEEDGDTLYKNSEIVQLYLKRDSQYSYLTPIKSMFKRLEHWRDGDILRNKMVVDEREFFSEVVKVMAEECKCWFFRG